jgi:hypothetical protein
LPERRFGLLLPTHQFAVERLCGAVSARVVSAGFALLSGMLLRPLVAEERADWGGDSGEGLGCSCELCLIHLHFII